MRRRTSLSIWLILGLVAVLGTAPSILAKQGGDVRIDMDSSFEDGINIERVDNPDVEASTFTFVEDAAYIPERTTDAEAIAVKVLAGTLAFRVQSPNVIIDPQGKEIQLVHTQPEIPLGEPPMNIVSPSPSFSPGGPLMDVANACSGDIPTNTLCELNPSLFANGDTFVLLEPGYAVYLPPFSTCFFCNVTTVIPPADPDLQGSQARLLVWASDSEIAKWSDPNSASTDPEYTAVQGQRLHEIRSWAINPGSPCH
jgi:hypothetical protein